MTSGALPLAAWWRCTTRCNLRCAHCDLHPQDRLGFDDPSTGECLRATEELASLNSEMVLVLAGGDALLRSDIEELAARASRLGMTVLLQTNGTLLSGSLALRLRESGVAGIGLAVDSIRPEQHDRLRGRQDCWGATVAAVRACAEARLSVAVQTSVFRWNREELPAIAEFVVRAGATAWNVCFASCTGRAMRKSDLSPEEEEETLVELGRLQRAFHEWLSLTIQCVPGPMVGTPRAGRSTPFLAGPNGCPASIHLLRDGAGGGGSACPYLPDGLENPRQSASAPVWTCSPLLKRRTSELGPGAPSTCRTSLHAGPAHRQAVRAGRARDENSPEAQTPAVLKAGGAR